MAMRPPADADERTRVPLPPPLIYLAGVLAGLAIGHFLPLALPQNSVVLGLGILWIVTGAGLAFWGLVVFRRAGTTFNPFGGTTAIVSSGPYRYTRNPMYVGLACVHLGCGLLLGEGWVLAALPVVVVLVDRLVIRREEIYLARKYGDTWHEYAHRVRRWI
jgi:protein-S-isoprenylcysteine O-methyltransferase Ste14